ncbi:hypothetical protein MKX03_030322 [Papaver bracteatum]|nr:hypothetical protein MKX03_030322 [Papaver bracteatum]
MYSGLLVLLVTTMVTITSTSWHLMVTFCTLHVARRFNVFKTKAIDTETVMLFGTLNGVSTGLLDLCLRWNYFSVQMVKLAFIPFTVLLETTFLNKVSLSIVQVCISNCICFVNVLLKLCLIHALSKFILCNPHVQLTGDV